MFILSCMLLTVAVSAQVPAHQRGCHPDYEYSCDDGRCVSTLVWCDGIEDCQDGSDESRCTRAGQSQFEVKARGEVDELAVAKAAEYFMRMKDADNGWGSFTPRAIVAMSFASRVSPIEEKELMIKQLNIRLLLDLMEHQNNLSSSRLALYINALYATCQDPHNFQGIDLVARLRSDTDAALLSNSSIPLAYLTLCIAGQIKLIDTHRLADMYMMEEFQRPGSRALIVMAMACYTKNEANPFSYRVNDFLTVNRPPIDVYSKALFMQTSIAKDAPLPLEELTKEQLSDGSFGDMLATYYAIPVLMGSSLLDLKCNGTTDAGMGSSLKGSGSNHVTYSLWISTGSDFNSHSRTISFDGEKTFFEIMLIISSRDSLYRFLYDKVGEQKRVYSIAGIPNDAESGKSWMLYRGKYNHVIVNSVQNLQSLPVDVNIPAKDQDHFVFWFTRS